MNFEEVIQFISELPKFKNCDDKKDFQEEIDSMSKDELEEVEVRLADKIIEEFNMKKKEMKEARYNYFK